jgi:hypothetical protein
MTAKNRSVFASGDVAPVLTRSAVGEVVRCPVGERRKPRVST